MSENPNLSLATKEAGVTEIILYHLSESVASKALRLMQEVRVTHGLGGGAELGGGFYYIAIQRLRQLSEAAYVTFEECGWIRLYAMLMEVRNLRRMGHFDQADEDLSIVEHLVRLLA